MRIFLVWADKYSQIDDLVTSLQKKGHEILYWVGAVSRSEDPSENKGKIPGAIYHDHFDARRASPAPGVDIEEFPPVSRELLEKFLKLESTILTMMNKEREGVCVDRRKRIYYNILRYWHGVLKKYQPELIIFPVIPHTTFDYVIHELAKSLNIKTIMFKITRACDRLFMFGDWRQGSLALRHELAKNEHKNFTLEDLSPDIREYYESQLDPKQDSSPAGTKWHVKTYSSKNRMLEKFQKIIRGFRERNLLLRVSHFIITRSQSNLKKEYTSLQEKPDFSKPFVYVALGYQPEQATCPLGDIFCDQILMVETLSYALPDGWVLYVKEHPIQWWRRNGVIYSDYRYPRYYDRITRIKNVRLIPMNTDTYTLMNKSQAVAVVTGTVGWEALLRGKPAMIFGYPWYKDCYGLLRVDSVESARQAFDKIQQGFAPKAQKTINFLKCLENISIKAYMAFRGFTKDSDFTEEESKRNITKKVLDEIEKIQSDPEYYEKHL